MSNKHRNMALSHIMTEIGHESLPMPPSLFSGGLTCQNPFLPENILVWQSSSDHTVTDISIHQRMILKIILSGKVATVVDGLRMPMAAGDMILLFPFQFHTTQLHCRRDDYSFLAITFTLGGKDYAPLLPLKNHLLQPDALDAEAIAMVIRCHQHEESISPEEGVLALMGLLLRQRRKIQSTPQKEGGEASSDDLFGQICDYVRHNFDRQISLKTMAAEFHISEETVRRMFHRCYGKITPGKLIRRLRMQCAVELLERTEESIASVARRCGYLDTFVFSKAFKRFFGCSPLNHRKIYRRQREQG